MIVQSKRLAEIFTPSDCVIVMFGRNSFCEMMNTAEAIMPKTKALALNLHQCQRMVAGTRIIVTTTNIIVSQADMMLSKEKLAINATNINAPEAN